MKASGHIFVAPLIGLLILAGTPLISQAAIDGDGPKLGLQAWTCRYMTFEQIVDFATAHRIKYLEFTGQLSPAAPRGETLRKKAVLDEHGLVAYAMGVSGTSLSKEDNRRMFELARLVGMKLIVVEPKDPAIWDNLEALAKEYDIKVAVHNHWRGSLYGEPNAVKQMLARHRDPHIGVCLDLGWITAAGFDAAKVFQEYGDRVFDIHLKDKKADKGVETMISDPLSHPSDPARKGSAVIEQVVWRDTLIGEGDVNLREVFQAIAATHWSGVMALETDSNELASDPAPYVDAAARFFKSQVAAAAKP